MVVLGIIVFIGIALRFYNFNWGDGFFFHPDERNIAFGVSNLNLDKGQLNPKFWAYGSLPIYVIYIIAWLIDKIPLVAASPLNFDSYILIGRLISALVSTAIIPFTYLIITRILKKKSFGVQVGLIGALWVTFLPGMIQFAHFMTFETFLTLQYLGLLWLSFNIAESAKSRDYILFGVLLGLSIGTKIVSFAMLPLLIAAHLGYHLYVKPKKQHRLFGIVFSKNLILALLVVPIFVFVASPFHFLDFNGFMNSFNYESGVADGSLLVFYTQQFLQTTPVLYQLTKVFPYILTIPLSLLSFTGFTYLLIRLAKAVLFTPKNKHLSLFAIFTGLTLLSTILYLGFHMSLFVKWTRYMVPALPFLVVIACLMLSLVMKRHETIAKVIVSFITLWVIGSGVMFFQVYLKTDTRMEAADFADGNLSRNAFVTSEEYDLGIIPFNGVFGATNITLLPLYDLESNPRQITALTDFKNSDYFIELSQRVWRTRSRLPDLYPQSAKLYQDLDGSSQWSLISQTDRLSADCNIFTLYCFGGTLTPDETFSVFDHPTIRIYENHSR